MRSTIDIDDALLEEAMKLAHVKTKRELIQLSLSELVRQKRRERLRSKLGKTDIEWTLADLQEMRRDEQ
ncbi:MAG: type II toxin-antitoxin system VapB family antitoxin [Acidobacteria bacterium]|nr:type II toxin-antitoxin system VapB family antitoxin [Acidobacteriota bacterium]